MDAEISFLEIEDQPAIPYVCKRQSQLVANEGAQLRWLGGVEETVDALDHVLPLTNGVLGSSLRDCDRIAAATSIHSCKRSRISGTVARRPIGRNTHC
jgi:hypothetical protein